jgi:hypothetical protein
MLEQLIEAIGRLIAALNANTAAHTGAAVETPPGAAQAVTAAQAAAAPKRGRPPKTAETAPAAPAAPSPAAAAVTAAIAAAPVVGAHEPIANAPPAGTPAPSFAALAEIFVRVAKEIGRDTAVSLLARYRVAKLPELAQKDYAAFYQDAQSTIAAAANAAAPGNAASGLI